MNLLAIPKGTYACIIDFDNVSPTIRQRLMHMGIYKGCHIKLQQVLPFGGPCMLEHSGQTIGIRQNEAKNIKVEII